MDQKKVVVLGCTGSIGTQALDVIRAVPDRFRLVGLSAGANSDLMLRQIQAFQPEYAVMADEAATQTLKKNGNAQLQIEAGEDAVCALAALPEADVIVMGISGTAAIKPLLAALQAGKTVALANKESIVCANDLVQAALRQPGAGQILPVDSEQSAIFQCLQNGSREEVSTLLLTASGGPFKGFTREELRSVTPAQALHHPTWNMGKKITIDSATMFNKGLEVIEAAYLFGFGKDQISVLIHPQSIVHSMVEYQDGSIMAQLSCPDMRLAIQYAMTYPERHPGPCKRLSLFEAGTLTFLPPPEPLNKALALAYAALEAGNAMPAVYNGANEEAVDLYLKGRIGFLDIYRAVEDTMAGFQNRSVCSVEELEEIDARAKRYVRDHFA